MLPEIGQILSLIKNPSKIKEEVEKLQHKLGQLTADGDAGGGMVKARVNGRLEVLSCSISDEAMRQGDKELLEDLITAAVNQALQKGRQVVAEETGKMASGLGLPPGMSLPGLQ
jgi:nucleoid-associated protein EbfC